MRPVTPWCSSSHPSGTRSGAGPPPILVTSNGILRARQEPVLIPQHERGQILRDGFDRHVADPDRLPRVGDARGQHDPLVGLGLAEVPHRTVQHGEAAHAVRREDRFGEEHRVLVVEQVQVDVERVVVGEQHGAEPSPLAQVGRHGQRGARAERAVGDIRHHVQPEIGHPRDARVLDAGIADAALPRAVWRKHDALRARHRPARRLDDHAREPDPRDVARGHQCAAAGTPPRRDRGRRPG